MVTVAKTARSRRTRAALVAAVHDRVTTDGSFTAEQIAEVVGCTPATFWAHFGTKDDAIGAAFQVALDDLVALTESLFGAGVPVDVEPWASAVVDGLVEYFAARALLYRAAIARFPEHRPLRAAYREAEVRAEAIIATALGAGYDPDDAVAVLVFCQGINNPAVLRSERTSRVRGRLAVALEALVTAAAR